MPLTEFQKQILVLLAKHRGIESHMAGGLVLNATEDSPRYSQDIDIFHEANEAVMNSSDRDVELLSERGYVVEKMKGDWNAPTSFRKANVAKDGKSVEIDWVADAAFRFFPVMQDEIFGWQLSWFDAAVNKVLALVSRYEARDYIDVVEISRKIPLAAVCWAACGKDEGYSPMLLLDMLKRFGRVRPEDVQMVKAQKIDLVELKKEWVEIYIKAEEELEALSEGFPDIPIGVAFVDDAGNPGWYRDDPTLKIHPISVRGCLPRISNHGN